MALPTEMIKTTSSTNSYDLSSGKKPNKHKKNTLNNIFKPVINDRTCAMKRELILLRNDIVTILLRKFFNFPFGNTCA